MKRIINWIKKIFNKNTSCANCKRFHSECFGHIPVVHEKYICKEWVENV